MQFSISILCASSLLVVSTAAASPQLAKRQQTVTCNEEGFILCPPSPPSTNTGGGGSSGGAYVPPYSLGPSPFEFITAIGGSVSAAASKRQAQEQFCCNPRLECRILNDYQVYICLDNNTSDFFMNDGSNGNAESGMYYNAPAEANINIFTGDYVFANGTRGNGYDDTGSPRPSRDVTGSIPQPTGDVVRDAEVTETASVTTAPTATTARGQSTTATRGASVTSAGASVTSAGSTAPTTTPNAAASLSMPGSSQILMMLSGLLWVL